MGRNILAAEWRSLNQSAGQGGNYRRSGDERQQNGPWQGPFCVLPVGEPTYRAARTRVTVSSASAVRVGRRSFTYCTKEAASVPQSMPSALQSST